MSFIGGKVVIGNIVTIQNNVPTYNAVTLEDFVFLGAVGGFYS